MTTITYRHGGGPNFMRLRQDDGSYLDPGAADLEVRVAAQGACIPIAGDPQGDGYLVDFGTLSLAPRLYPFSIYVNGQHEADGYLNITGGC